MALAKPIKHSYGRMTGFASLNQPVRHCERSEAIPRRTPGLDCFVAALLAM